MMVIISRSDEMKYSTAMPNPPKTSQMIFPSIFMNSIRFQIMNAFARKGNENYRKPRTDAVNIWRANN